MEKIFKIVLHNPRTNSYGFIFPSGYVGYTHLECKDYFYIPIATDEGFMVYKCDCTWMEIDLKSYHNTYPI